MHQSYAWATPFVAPLTVTPSFCSTTNTTTIVQRNVYAKLHHGVFIFPGNAATNYVIFFQNCVTPFKKIIESLFPFFKKDADKTN